MMAETESKSLQVKGKEEIATPEQTKTGPVFAPAVDIFETEEDLTLLADLPGVKSKDLTIDLRDNVLTLAAAVETQEGAQEVDILREYQTGNYFRQFTLSEMIDQSKIEAELKEGVLRLRMSKVEPAKPRKITVNPS
jgi:HSP20 family protein